MWFSCVAWKVHEDNIVPRTLVPVLARLSEIYFPVVTYHRKSLFSLVSSELDSNETPLAHTWYGTQEVDKFISTQTRVRNILMQVDAERRDKANHNSPAIVPPVRGLIS